MSLRNAFSAVRSSVSLDKIPSLRTTITVSDLDSLFSQCRGLRLFSQILCQTISTGLIKDTYAASRILKFSTDSPFVHIDYSYKIFTSIVDLNGFIWNTMLRTFVQGNRVQDSMSLYRSMVKNSPLHVDNYTHPILIHGCSLGYSEFEGREVHNHVVKMGYESDVFTVNNLINMYSVCRNVNDASKVFNESPVLDFVSWNTMLAGYVLAGCVEEAKLLYSQMPNKNVIATNSMIVLLGKSARVDEARQLFDEMKNKDMVSWTAMISCYEQNRMYQEALDMFLSMRHNGIELDEVVFVATLSACANLLSFTLGELVHGLVIRIGLDCYINLHNALIHIYSRCDHLISAQKLFNTGHFLDVISWNSMIYGYMKFGLVDKASELFNNMPDKDVVSWSSMISGYAQLGKYSETLELFHDMQSEGIKPDETTLVSVLSACTQLSAFDQGKWLHAYMRKNNMKVDSILGTTLIDMYMKCGNVENAKEVFLHMQEREVSSWNALILGLAMNGYVEDSLNMFEQMKRSKALPNEITFVAILSTCRHMGMVEEGKRYFNSMVEEYNIEPNVRHYGCLVDLLARRGLLKEAEDVIDTMPMPPDVSTWGAILGACKKHGDRETGERIGRKLIRLQPEHDGFHVLLSNIYASKGDWTDVQEIRGIMTSQDLVKTPGCSMIEADGVVHEFLAGDRSHTRIEEIEAVLNEIIRRSKRLAYGDDYSLDESLLVGADEG